MKIINDTYKGNLRYIAAQTEGVCSYAIELMLEDDTIIDVVYHGGCNGNLKGITCGPKNTSCPDQLAQLLKEISDTSSSDHTDEVL